MVEPTKREPTLAQAVIPLIVLIGLLAASVYLFGDGSSGGPNQIALILGTSVAIIIAMRNGYRWKEIERCMVHGIFHAFAV